MKPYFLLTLLLLSISISSCNFIEPLQPVVNTPIQLTNINPYKNLTITGDLVINGQVLLNNTVWDDIRTPASSTTLLGLRDPQLTLFKTNGTNAQGTYVLAFQNAVLANQQEVLYEIQVPHDYKLLSGLSPHIHYTVPFNTTCNFTVANECTWASFNEEFKNTRYIKTNFQVSSQQNIHKLQEVGEIDDDGSMISSMLICRFERLSADAGDTCTGDLYFLEIDFHYQKDSLGSQDEYRK